MSLLSQAIQPGVDLSPVTGKPGIDGEFSFNNCDDVHIGPKYENSNNIIINHNLAVSSDELASNLKNVIKEELQKPDCNLEIHKDPLYRSAIPLKLLVVTCLSLAAIVLIIILILCFNSDKENTPGKKYTVPDPTYNSADYPAELLFVMRESWGAAQPTAKQEKNILPVRRVIFIHTASSRTCNRFTACSQAVRDIQELHMDEDHNWGDIGYNFVLGGDGYIYVGVGWDKVGVHTYGFNNGSLGVAFIGDYRFDELNDKMISSAKQLLRFGVERGKLSEDFQLFGHCQLRAGFPYSPGKNIIKVIREWPHWNDTKISNCK